MGQKIHPYGLRLGIITDWKSRWYSEKDYALLVNEDHRIRKYLLDELKRGAVSRIDIERLGDKKVQIDIHTGRPGVVIGRGGSEADRLRAGLEKLSGRQVKFNVIEVANPELDATLLARSVADQLEGRVAFRRAMKRAVSTALKAGAEGVRIQASGRLGGSDMGRREWYLEGRVPLHTLRADVDYGTAVARPSVGAVGITMGLLLFGPKLIRTVGTQITRMNPMRAYCVALSAAVTVIVASALGLPVSSTHIAIGAIFGVGFYREWQTARRTHINHGRIQKAPQTPSEWDLLPPLEKDQRRKLVRRQHLWTIVAAWLITVPLSAILAGGIFFVMRALLG
ncbi:MAG: 30S ribosomal protein S3 [Acidobacteria bacterium]|nr:30S ribosomal protein S3 [Acidobacteriota bacterium]